MTSKLRYCATCKWSRPARPDEAWAWDLRCTNPAVNADDSWALASAQIRGASCRSERERGIFAPCGKRGAQWEQKP